MNPARSPERAALFEDSDLGPRRLLRAPGRAAR